MPIDTGKTLLLDRMRKSSVQAREAGGITQHIGASFFPMKTLLEICGPILGGRVSRIKIPGLLVIDTPGHEAFANLRRRGGGVADIAILVIDVLKGFEAQTYECIEVLKARRTPFLVAANKIDRISGWKPIEDSPFFLSSKKQDPYVLQDLEERIYSIIGTFSRLGFRANRFDKITDFTRNVAIVPVSAKTGEGIPELLAVLIGLTQQYLKDSLEITEGPARGTVLEVKEEPGLGMTINAIIYDGVLRKGDIIVVGGKEKPIVTRVRALLQPKPLDEIRDPRDKFTSIEEVSAAAGVKIAAPELEDVIAGAPLYVSHSGEDTDKLVTEVLEEIQSLRIHTDTNGVVLKTDTLGSLEAIAESLKRHNIPLRIADVGDVSKRDVVEARVVKAQDPLYGVVLAFNVKVLPDAEIEARDRMVPIFKHKIIYHLIDEYLEWVQKEEEARRREELDRLILPGKIKVLPGYIFRKAKPAIFGVEVLAGVIKPRVPLVRRDGKDLGEISQIQEKGEAISEARVGMQVAISMNKPVIGKHIKEGDVLYVKVPEDHAKALSTRLREYLSEDEAEALREYLEKMKEENAFSSFS